MRIFVLFRQTTSLQHVVIDVLGPFTPDRVGNKYILSMVDMHSRYLGMQLLPTTDIASIIRVVLTLWFCRWGALGIIHGC